MQGRGQRTCKLRKLILCSSSWRFSRNSLSLVGVSVMCLQQQQQQGHTHSIEDVSVIVCFTLHLYSYVHTCIYIHNTASKPIEIQFYNDAYCIPVHVHVHLAVQRQGPAPAAGGLTG